MLDLCRNTRSAALCLILSSATLCFAQGESWTQWEGFDAKPGEGFKPWKAEDWPLTKGCALKIGEGHSSEGMRSAEAEISMIGWAGAIRALKMKPEPATKETFRASIFCVALPGASGAPMAKLEVYRTDNAEAMSGDDTPLRLNQWTEIQIPAGRVSNTWDGLGVIFFPGEAKGSFHVIVDDIRIGTETWEGFENGLGQKVWEGESISGIQQVAIVDTLPERLDSGVHGKCCMISWKGDTDGVELKHHAPQAIDMLSFQKLRLRAATTTTKATVGLWLWDGAKGTVVPPDHDLEAGDWGEITYDLAGIGGVNLSRMMDVGFVVSNYEGDSGTIYLDSIKYQGDGQFSQVGNSGKEIAAGPRWSRFDAKALSLAMETGGNALVYVRSANTPFCRVFERTYLFAESARPTLGKQSLFFVDTATEAGRVTAKGLAVSQVPTLLLLRSGQDPVRFPVSQNTSREDILSFLDGL